MTPKQRDVLDFVEKFWSINGCGPSYEEIAEGVGLKSKGNAHRLVAVLRAAGWVWLNPKRARTVRSMYRDRKGIKKLKKLGLGR